MANHDAYRVGRKVDLILINRLRQLYWPTWLRRMTIERVLRAKPCDFEDERLRPLRRNYDAGRIHFMLIQLRRREPLDPIDVEATWSCNTPDGLWVSDGHHRLVASVLARKRRILANVWGIVATRDWLVGKTRRCPL